LKLGAPHNESPAATSCPLCDGSGESTRI
jgi:hypothetical protein